MKDEDLFEIYNTSFETVKKVMGMFFQDDFRYLNLYDEIMVAGFIDNKAISIKKGNFKEEEIKKSKMKMKGPQQDLKQVAVRLLKERGFEIKGFEVGIRGGIVDLLASKENQQIAVECGPCRVDKAIEYLKIPNTILWLLTRKNEKSEYVLFEIKRDENWDEFFKRHENYKMKSTKKAVEKAFLNV